MLICSTAEGGLLVRTSCEESHQVLSALPCSPSAACQPLLTLVPHVLVLLSAIVTMQAAVLQGGRVGPDFFAALSRVRAIHEHCK